VTYLLPTTALSIIISIFAAISAGWLSSWLWLRQGQIFKSSGSGVLGSFDVVVAICFLFSLYGLYSWVRSSAHQACPKQMKLGAFLALFLCWLPIPIAFLLLKNDFTLANNFLMHSGIFPYLFACAEIAVLAIFLQKNGVGCVWLDSARLAALISVFLLSIMVQFYPLFVLNSTKCCMTM
jgi:hypothetical protein